MERVVGDFKNIALRSRLLKFEQYDIILKNLKPFLGMIVNIAILGNTLKKYKLVIIL